ncbi:MAG TPA: DUF502 domain-containing protein [Candidatus Eisenbacteria bacterium]|jgi:uncharacterized membrane protein|nr:DUF502 domain-containing protein [Candidatus Eisenbacteria bacterium]
MFARLRTHFLTGLLVLSPVVVTGYIIWRLFTWVDHMLGTTLRGGYIRPGGVPGLGFLTVILIIIVTGALAENILGRRLGKLVDTLLLRIPLLRGLYSTVKDIGTAVLGDRRMAFNQVVLVPFPIPGVYSIGLVTTDAPASLSDAAGKPLRGIFLPTPPNPTTGPLLYYPDDQVIPTTMRVDQAIKIVVSAGVVVPPPPITEEDRDLPPGGK